MENKIKKRNPVVLEMQKMKGFGTHEKTNKQKRRRDKVFLNSVVKISHLDND